MPVKSKAQLRKLFVLEDQGKLKKGTAEEFAKETPDYSKLPERLHPKKKKDSADSWKDSGSALVR
jgi:hypothetical protein